MPPPRYKYKLDQLIIVDLTKEKIDAIFERRKKKRWDAYLAVYDYLLKEMPNAHALPDYGRKFNYFYQVRRNLVWRKKFYALFYESRGKEVDFANILRTLFQNTEKIEASFASKMAATLNPDLPIIDRHVLSYIGRKLPSPNKGKEERIAAIIVLYEEMERTFKAFLKTDSGKHLLKRFRGEYPESTISEMKMLDFVLWQSGGNGARNKK